LQKARIYLRKYPRLEDLLEILKSNKTKGQDKLSYTESLAIVIGLEKQKLILEKQLIDMRPESNDKSEQILENAMRGKFVYDADSFLRTLPRQGRLF